MSEPVELGSGIQYNRVTGKHEVLKGTHWVTLDESIIDGLPADLAALDPTTLKSVAGVGAGYKVARGIHQIVDQSDDVDTGLASVVAAVVGFQDPPTVNINAVAANVGDQSVTPAAGHILITSYAPTAVNDVTPVAATTFTDNMHVAWIAVGT